MRCDEAAIILCDDPEMLEAIRTILESFPDSEVVRQREEGR